MPSCSESQSPQLWMPQPATMVTSAPSPTEVVVDQIVEAGLAQDDRNVDVFALGEGRDADVDAVLVGLGDNLDVLGVLAELLLPVEADVDRAVGDGDHVGDGLQDAFLDVVQHVPFTSSRLQPATVWDSRRG